MNSLGFISSAKKALFAVAAIASGVVFAANPIQPSWEYVPHGEPYVFEDPDNPGRDTVNRPVSMSRTEVGAVRVCTYNIGWAAGSPTHPGCWASRRADVAALVCSSSPDVVALQEVVPAQAGYLRGKMPEYGFAGEYRNEDRTSGQGNLVAWRRDRFELVETRTFWLSETPDVPGSRSWGSGWLRTCTLAALRDKRTGVRICVASVHLDCASPLAKEEGMRLVLRRLPDFSAGAPVILAGDFNSNETDTAPMLAAKEMTYALYASETPPTGPWGTTCAGFRRKSPPMSFADAQRVPLSERCTKEGTRRYGERIDYIFVSKGVRVLDYATYDVLRPGLDLYPSDHFPVVATLKFPGEDNGLGQDIRLFKDDDGKAYMVCKSNSPS